MCSQIAYNQNDYLGIGITFFKHSLDEMSPVNSRPTSSNFYIAFLAKWFHLKKYT